MAQPHPPRSPRTSPRSDARSTATSPGGRPADEIRFEVRSAEDLDALASAPLPLGLGVTPARRSMHRDLHLDTRDGSLVRRGVLCRLRIGASDQHRLTLRVPGEGDAEALRVDSWVRSADPAAALA